MVVVCNNIMFYNLSIINYKTIIILIIMLVIYYFIALKEVQYF